MYTALDIYYVSIPSDRGIHSGLINKINELEAQIEVSIPSDRGIHSGMDRFTPPEEDTPSQSPLIGAFIPGSCEARALVDDEIRLNPL